MQQYFVNENVENKKFILSSDDSFHIVRVMRKNVYDKVYVAFANEKRYVCNIVELDVNGVGVVPIEEVTQTTELPVDITIAIPPLKNDKLEYLIQKATELGVKNIVLFNSERNIAKIKADKVESKLKRWEKIVKEAAEQSKRAALPTLSYKSSIKELIASTSNIDYKVIAYENEAQNSTNNNLSQLLHADLYNKSVIAIFGSEGGLAQGEVDTFTNNDYKTIGLGKRILRAETAPLYFVSCVSYFAELD